MKILCDREKLREGLSIVNNVIPARSPKPVLENVCFVATDDLLELVGTDLEVGVRYSITDVKVSEPGVSVIPARVTLDFIRDLSSETVTLHTDDGTCTIQGGSDSCELVTIDPDEFPVLSRFDEDGTLSVQAGTFTKLVGNTAFAAAREAGRYAMHGVMINVSAAQLQMIATDGRRLAMSSASVEETTENIRPAIVPTKGVQLFCRVLTDPLENVELHFGENQMGMRTSTAEVFARLIDGDYPNYEAVIPASPKNAMTANCELLGRKLRLVANVTGEEARAVKMKLSRDELELFGRSAGRGEATAHMEVQYSGAESAIAFNPDYVLDGLKHCEADSIRLEFNDRSSPGKFCLGENQVYVVMPITIDT